MKISFGKLALAALLLSMGTAHAQTLEASGDYAGHHYQVWSATGISWEDANNFINDPDMPQTHMGVQGHLVTVTSAGEDDYVEGLRAGAGLSRPEVWAGGLQNPATPVATLNWVWITGESAIATGDSRLFNNWQAGEPNDTGTGGEQYLGLGHTNVQGWNDEGNLGNIGGFVVEYDLPIGNQATECVPNSSNGYCQTNIAQRLTLPNLPALASVQLNATTYQFSDNPERCGPDGEPLVLFDGALTIPPIYCGDPLFWVVKTETPGFSDWEGTVAVENSTTNFPDAAGQTFLCEDPININYPTIGDPQEQEVVLWQATDKAEMLETTAGFGPYAGSATDVTEGCGSSKGRVRELSYHVMGLEYRLLKPVLDNEGANTTWATNPDGVFDAMVDLIDYRLDLLLQAVTAANSAKVIKNGDYTKMMQMATNAKTALGAGDYADAYTKMENFIKFIDKAKVKSSSFNHFGELRVRSGHIEYMLRVKLIPYAAL
jgi:hypothetical protein